MSQVVNCSTDPLGAFCIAKKSIASGDVIVIPTDTVYGLAADAFQPQAVEKLLEIKGRMAAPPVLVGNLETFEAVVETLPKPALALARHFWPGPLTIVLRTRPGLLWGDTIAVRQPDNTFLLQLLCETGPLAVSSANVSGKKPALSIRSAKMSLDRISHRRVTQGTVTQKTAGNITSYPRPALYVDGGKIDNPDRIPSSIVDLTDFCNDSTDRQIKRPQDTAQDTVPDPEKPFARLLRPGKISREALQKVAGIEFLPHALSRQDSNVTLS